MQNKLKNPFSIQNVCQTLLKNGLLTNIQIKEISKKKDVAREKLERQRAQRLAASRSELKIVNPINIIDVIVSLELSRADKPSWPLDEEIIYQTLAKKWTQTRSQPGYNHHPPLLCHETPGSSHRHEGWIFNHCNVQPF